jgi:hypothetical protein
MIMFYDDPLAAAYMAREFGVKLDRDTTAAHKKADYINRLLGSVCGGNIGKVSPVMYIHPDSLHIFEPQVGDYVQFGEDHYGLFKKLRSDKYYENFVGVKIIQRNNRPFFWPESEANPAQIENELREQAQTEAGKQ